MTDLPVSAAASQVDVRRLVAQTTARRNWRDALLRRMLALADAAAIVVVSASFAALSGDNWRGALFSLALLPVWILLAKLSGLYDNDHRALRHLTADEFPQVFTWALRGSVIACLVLYWAPGVHITVESGLAIFAIVLTSDLAFRAAARIAWRRLVPPERTVILGDGPLAEAARRKIELFRDIHTTLVEPDADFSGVDRIIVASHQIDEDQIADLVAHCRRRQIKLSVIPPVRGMFGTAAQLKRVADLPVLEYNTWDVSRSTLALKRTIDLCVSATLIVLLAPLLVLIGLAIALESRGPVVIGQPRAGKDGKPFRMFKFRTMVPDAAERLPEVLSIDALSEPVFKLRNDPRVTRIGRLLRRTSADELAQLFNVLRGEMSLVGPRPEELEIVRLYRPEHLFRMMVKPGMTGPMQIYGRGELTFDERLAVEREYIENLSIGNDLGIISRTLAAVVSGHGAY